MSLTFDPDSNAQPNGTWDTTFLSDRDVSSQVPINFVPHPGVYVTAACFGTGIYNDTEAENCLSNLLYSQIRRYVIDVYWDPFNSRYSLCPVQIPPISSTNSSQTITSAAVADNTINVASLSPRQDTTTFVSNSSSIQYANQTSTSTSVPPSYSLISTEGNSNFVQIGPYSCSSTLTLASVTDIFSDFLVQTSNTLDAKVLVWIINLRVAAPWDEPMNSPNELSPDQLPPADRSVSSYLNSLDKWLYEPGELLSDRENLNASWFRRVTQSELPLVGYYNLRTTSSGDLATDDGWPNEDYVQVVDGKRMLVGYGSVADALFNYNTSADGDKIYPPNYIIANRDVTFDQNGELRQGCFYEEDVFSLDRINNSWAMATINQINPPDLGDAADNLTTCGISQLLNVTINGITANTEAGPYQSFGNNAVFSWAYGEPKNESSINVDNDQKFRCALMISTDAYQGHWTVQFCSQSYHVACREGIAPYRWRISDYKVPYGSGDAACPLNTTFDVPRTGLENRYLWNKIRRESTNDPSLLDGIWINFNSLDVQSCWVTTGVNGTCPYYLDQSATHSRQILIPAVAALIVLILTILTILVKCSANARNSRKRRRGEGGWDYEGIPS